MFISKGKASIVLWIACIAIFLATLAPTVSRALTVASGMAVPSLEICSVAGGMNMSPATLSNDAPDSSKSGMRMADCPCCSMHADTLSLPPTSLVLASGELITGLLPELFYQSATPLFAWTPVQPRGPPAAF
ncbi:hypothetical protein CNX70_14500 [Janthinobacterium svalbardensis]|uniref:DUF2946 domain-containing protein n=1 Tax=Janthinobacterium svalbardensis TaxID=368607 RepID=A0A290WWG6_9BURK|nr:DUF2946 domain-containing protein [Janthinobacterium svalbardensis]ATD61232.1 hypothetical protein CNX70_14500 [Janthinobacterium svalbardensis]